MNPKTMKWVGTLVVGSYGLFSLWFMFIIDRWPIGDLSYGEYSIYSSEGFFYAYHIWGVILSGVTLYGMWKEIRIFFLLGFMLLGIQMFYPSFTSTQVDRQKGKELMEEKARQDSIRNAAEAAVMDSSASDNGAGGVVTPPPMDQLGQADSTEGE